MRKSVIMTSQNNYVCCCKVNLVLASYTEVFLMEPNLQKGPNNFANTTFNQGWLHVTYSLYLECMWYYSKQYNNSSILNFWKIDDEYELMDR